MDRLGDKVCCNPTVKLKKGEYYPLIDIEKIAPGYKTVRNQEEIVFNGQSCTKFEDRDVLFARITPCLENGKIAMADTNGKCGIGSTELFVFRGIEGISNTDFVYYLLRMNHIRQLAANSMTGASGRQRADLNFIKKIKWQFPVIEQQQKIASILTVYDNLIENNNKRIKILEQMAENLYKEWFVRFRFPCRNKIILQKRSPSGWVISSKATDMVCPENWEYGLFSRLGKFVRGKNITVDKMIEGNIPVVSAGLEPSGYHNVHNVTGKSLTISASGANAGYLKYHLSDIWAADCSYFQDDSKLWFVYNALKFLQPVISNLQIGAAQPHVYPKNINKLCTVIPDDDTMHMYCEKVEPIYEQIQRLKEENQNLIKQRDMLLPRLMSGNLEVK